MADKRRNLGIPSGVVFPFAGTAAPYGYLVCDGSAISRSDYSSLFATLGTSHGQGDGSTTFNLPDYRGRFMRGVDGTAGNDPDKASRTAMATGGNTGDAVGAVQDDQSKSHNHFLASTVGGGEVLNSDLSSTGYIARNGGGLGLFQGYQLKNTTGPASVGLSSDVGGTESRPKNVNVNYIIKV